MSGQHTKRARVRRITIDERLAPELVKIGVAYLLPGHTDLSDDRLEAWSDERVRLVRPATYLRTFGLRRGDPLLDGLCAELPVPSPGEGELEGALWRSLEEGQVYLAGEFEVRGSDRGRPEAILARMGARDVLRIDRIPAIKQKHKDLYSAALKEGN